MKTISFFNKKGGVGKSSFSIMYASFLAYKYGQKVAVIDLDNRLEALRISEINGFKEKCKWNSDIQEKMWKLITVRRKDIITNPNTNGYMIYFKKLYETELNDYDVVIIDLPGSMLEAHLQLIKNNMIQLFVLPLDKDTQTVIAGEQTVRFLNSCKQNCCGFINQIQTYVSKAHYYKTMQVYQKYNFKILPDMVAYTERMKKLDGEFENDVMRSTLSYPDWDKPEFKGSRDLGIDNLFIDITKILNEMDDIPNTEHSRLEFIESMEKSASDMDLNRQLNDSSFPKLEIELPEKMKTAFKKNR